MLKQDIIELSESPWSSPIVLVRKKNGTMRLYIDYRKVNDVMKDSFPVSRIDNELDALSGAEWFNVLDLQRCYFQVICDKTTVKRPHLLLKMGVINLKSCLWDYVSHQLRLRDL